MIVSSRLQFAIKTLLMVAIVNISGLNYVCNTVCMQVEAMVMHDWAAASDLEVVLIVARLVSCVLDPTAWVCRLNQK